MTYQSTCQKCGQPIRWISTESGSVIAVDQAAVVCWVRSCTRPDCYSSVMVLVPHCLSCVVAVETNKIKNGG